jgi:uncharacterized glyoxalase superfamily protein PhnB
MTAAEGTFMAVKPVPEGYHSVTPYMMVKDVADVIDFAKTTFGATEKERFARPDGTVMHAEIRIGDSIIMMGEAPNGSVMPAMLHVYVADVDDAYRRAIGAGAKSLRAPENQFYGDRSSGVEDSSGNQWWISTHVEDVSPEEMHRREAAAPA